MPQRILVTGASGFLGGNFCRKYASEFEIYGTYTANPFSLPGVTPYRLDLTDEDEIEDVYHLKPDAIIHLAALSNPNICEQSPQLSDLVNVTASAQLAFVCRELNIPYIFASTDLVFDGIGAPYCEADLPNPVNIYGSHKLQAELDIDDIYPDAVICRLPLMYGAHYTTGKSFLQSILENLGNGQPVRLFTDEYRTVASADSISEGLKLALAHSRGGILHLGGEERLSRYEMGRKICWVFGFDENLLQACLQQDVEMPAPRPSDVSLNNHKARNLGWQPGLMEDELRKIKDLLLTSNKIA